MNTVAGHGVLLFLLGLGVSGAVGPSAVAAASGPAPAWLRDSETYAVGWTDGDWAALAGSEVAFMTHCPVSSGFFARCHALGIRCLPYATFYQLAAGRFVQGINLADHPGWVAFDAGGQPERSRFWNGADGLNTYAVCPNTQEYQDSMVAWVRRVVELGADGLFVDNLASAPLCYGERLGKHKHIVPTGPAGLQEAQNQAFALLLSRIRQAVLSVRPDGALIGNAGSTEASFPPAFWDDFDAAMDESFICSSSSDDRGDWTRWNALGAAAAPFLQQGKAVLALSYVGQTPFGRREDAFYCYAGARLSGLAWNGDLPVSDPSTADLYRLRLGAPLTGEMEEGGVFYRIFERGLVAVNPAGSGPARSIAIGPSVPGPLLFDVCGRPQADSWAPAGQGGYDLVFEGGRGGNGSARAIRCFNGNPDEDSGAVQGIDLDPPESAPIVVEGFSRAEDVPGTPSKDYGLYADLHFADGGLSGQGVAFDTGTHDWQKRSLVIRPGKAVRRIELYILFRKKTGTAWFDDIELRTDCAPGVPGPDRIENGSFDRETHAPRLLDLASGRLEVPANSGRVYLFASGQGDALAQGGPELTVTTVPSLGNVHFRVDGFDYWTHSGRMRSGYVQGADFGQFHVVFGGSGRHTVEVVDVVAAPLTISTGPDKGEVTPGERDPADPTRPVDGRSYRFVGFGTGAGTRITVEVPPDSVVVARFEEGSSR